MIGILYIITKIVSVFLTILQLLMMFRALISWLPIDEDSNIANFLYAMTEPVVYPIRMLLDRFDSLSDLPVDISFLVAFMILSVIQMLLPVITVT